MQEREAQTVLGCRHAFHALCLAQCVAAECPLCRAPTGLPAKRRHYGASKYISVNIAAFLSVMICFMVLLPAILVLSVWEMCRGANFLAAVRSSADAVQSSPLFWAGYAVGAVLTAPILLLLYGEETLLFGPSSESSPWIV